MHPMVLHLCFCTSHLYGLLSITLLFMLMLLPPSVILSAVLALQWEWTRWMGLGLPGVALVVKNLLANAQDIRDADLIPGLGRFPGEGHGKPLQYSCLENPTDRGACWATVHWVAKSQTGLKQLSTHAWMGLGVFDIPQVGSTGKWKLPVFRRWTVTGTCLLDMWLQGLRMGASNFHKDHVDAICL